MSEFRMPSLGADMEAGTLALWRKQPGDVVQRGDIIAEVETEKGVIEVEVFTPGIVERLLVTPGTQVPVGTVLAVLRDAAAATATAVATPATLASVPEPASASALSPAAASNASTTESLLHRKAAPAARHRARELGVALESITGTGPHGSITIADVERAAATRAAPPVAAGAVRSSAPASADAQEQQQLRMRQAIAAAMTRSKREIPHYYAASTVDLTATLEWLEKHNQAVVPAERILPAVVYLKAVALALREFPELNGRREESGAVVSQGIHVGAAIALRGGGLVAPALTDTDVAPLSELMRRFRDLVTRARAGTLRSSEFSMGTITVTSLGDRGTDTVFGVIYPPQVAIVGFGKLVERPWVVAGSVVPRRLVHVTLAADHRVSDGHRGALFLDAIDRLLQAPEAL
ncbi:MAG TPA: dihydrolipoamide acetyltransferase family protein [Polyangiaceae bacterium]|nr:dihydrolipoamide acetyltransferase family protein [Polyangiaceae bacterium]